MHAKRINPVTTSRARTLRGEITNAERVLWRAIRSRQVQGNRFRRQHPIGPYIADFACIEQKLVIELDGGQHQDRQAHDKQRDAFIKTKGWRVLRFWNNDVLDNLDGVLLTIVEDLSHAPPS